MQENKKAIKKTPKILTVKTFEKIPDDALKNLSELLNGELVGLSAEMINLPIIMRLEAQMHSGAFLVNPAVKCIYEVMNEIDGGEMKLSGLNHLLKYPEYSDAGQLGALLGTLESQDEILDLVSEADNDNINVLIGSESSVKVMNNSALVYKPVVRDGKTLGAIGIIGPRRMDYAKVVATIEGLAGNVESILNDKELVQEKNGGNTDD